MVRSREAPLAEVNSVGLVSGDSEPMTRPNADGVAHPQALTENSHRSDLGRDPRPSYTLDPEDRAAGVSVVYEIDGERVAPGGSE